MFHKWPMVIVVVVCAAFALAGRAQADGTPTPGHMEGMPESGGHDHGERIPANGASVKILSPKDGEVLGNPTVIVRVETVNWPLGEQGHHWHLYVNGKEQGMSQGNSPALQARDLLPGENVIEATLSNELHQELDAVDEIMIHYDTGNQAGETTAPTPLLPAGVMIVVLGIVVTVAAILGIGFALTRKKTR